MLLTDKQTNVPGKTYHLYLLGGVLQNNDIRPSVRQSVSFQPISSEGKVVETPNLEKIVPVVSATYSVIFAKKGQKLRTRCHIMLRHATGWRHLVNP